MDYLHKKVFSDLHERYAKEHSNVATDLRAKWPERIGDLLFNQLQLIREEGDPQLQVNIVQYFRYSLQGFIESCLFFLLNLNLLNIIYKLDTRRKWLPLSSFDMSVRN